MISLSLVICLIGLIVWFLTVNVNKLSQAWVTEVSKIMFTVGLLAYLLSFGVKPIL